MANIVQVECNNMLESSLGLKTYTATTTPIKMRLLVTGTTSTATTAGTELSASGGYASGGVSLAGAFPSTATAGSITNSALAVNYTNMPAATIVGVEIWDATPTRKWFGALSASKTTNSGDTLSFATSTLTLSLS